MTTPDNALDQVFTKLMALTPEEMAERLKQYADNPFAKTLRELRQVADHESLVSDDAADRIVSLEVERDEADRRAGAAEREMQTLKDTIARLNSVRSKQKREWGVDENTSFDAVWNEALALKAQCAQAQKELTTQTNRAAAAEQQVTALTQRLDTANALNKEARNQLAQLSQVQAVPSDPLLSLEANAHEIFNNPPSETRQEVRDVIEWYAASVRVALAFPTSPPARKECWCETCRPVTLSDMRFVVCPDCGNKRCPKANNHDNACTSSNAPGQPGSSWEHVKPPARKGLSDEQAKAIVHNLCLNVGNWTHNGMSVLRATEAAHGIKGEGNE